MDLATGAMGSLIPKLLQLLQDEFNLHKDVRGEVESLSWELESMQVALAKVAEVPRQQLDPQVRLWARDVREASYDMEDILDTFLVRVDDDDGGRQPAAAGKHDMASKFKHLVEKMSKRLSSLSLSKMKARHGIAGAIDDIKKQVDDMTKRRDRYRVNDLVANHAATTSIDPRLSSFFPKASELVGIHDSTKTLIKMLCPGDDDDDASDKKMKIVCIVGSGGLGKTTLAKVVYDKFTLDMKITCKAFVPVGQNPDLKKVLRDILIDLDMKRYTSEINLTTLDERQLINELREFLKNKRYFIVIDDIWEAPSWKKIRIAFDDENNLGSKIIVTTRSIDVAKLVHCSYEINPLRHENSKKLFYGRIFGSEDRCPEELYELSANILKKCGGVPLAIITMSSLLANKLANITVWEEVYKSIGSGINNAADMCNMRNILALSYYDLPSHMKTCFLYLSMYPEDCEIESDPLIWKWIGEGFIQPSKNGDDVFELGKGYFNDLINRSLVQPIGRMDSKRGIYGCRVHDMILDLICSLAREENFVTILDDVEKNISSESKHRRLSIKNGMSGTLPKLEVSHSQVRSIALFGASMHSMASISCFDAIRVLHLEARIRPDKSGDNKPTVKNLIHVRCLILISAPYPCSWFLEGIEKLQFLQVLRTDLNASVPLAIFKLRRLMCLEGVSCYPANLLRNLSSLQVLKRLWVDKYSAGALEVVGHLTQLRDLEMIIDVTMDQNLSDAFINSLGNLTQLRTLTVRHVNNLIGWDHWAPPAHLHELELVGDPSLRALPKWISPASLPLLSILHLDSVDIVQAEDIQIIGTLAALCRLTLSAGRENLNSPSAKVIHGQH